jgi:cyclic pyranopterin phosphate synthase
MTAVATVPATEPKGIAATLLHPAAVARIAPFLPEGTNVERVVAAAQLAVMKLPAIADCTPQSIVLAVARIAGIQAAKRTDELIPLCHSLPLDYASVDFETGEDRITIRATVSTSAKTGVEMEALVAVSTAGLALYDMLKAVDKNMVLGEIRVLEKTKQ